MDGRFIAVVGNIGTTEIWDLDDLSLVHKLEYEYSGDDSVAFSPDSKTFLSEEKIRICHYTTPHPGKGCGN